MSSQFSFKQRETNRMPEGWKVMRLGEQANVRYGLGQPPALEANGIPMVRATNVKRGKIVREGLIFLNPNAVPNSRNPFLRVGDVLVVRSGAYTGDVALVTKEWEGAVAGYDLIVTPSDTIDSKFLTYYLLSPSVQKKHFMGLKVRSAQPHLNSSQLEETPIPLPPLSEQKKIAEILSTVDQAIEKVDQAIEKTQRLKKGLMQELLTKGIGHKEFKDTEIGRIPKEWKIMKLGKTARVRYGLGQPPALETNGIPMIRATNVKRGRIAKEGLISINRSAIPNSRDPFLRAGDILVIRSGAYTGDVALVTKEWEGAVAGYDLIVTPSDIIDSQFLACYLLSSSVQKRHFVGLKVRSAQPHLNSSQVEETQIPIPPLPEQQKIAEVLSGVDRRLELLRKRKERLGKIKKGLMNDLLTGRKRVILN